MANNKGSIDISRIPVDGPAGLGLAAMAAVVVYALAQLRALIGPVLLGALVVALTLLAWRHRETRRAAVAGLVLAAIALVGLLVGTIAHHA